MPAFEKTSSKGTKRERRKRLGFLLRVAHRHFAAAMQKGFGKHKVSHSEFLHLYLLYHWGTLSPSEITKRLEVTKSSATAVLKILAAKQMIIIAPNASDSRKSDVVLSNKGRKTIEVLLACNDRTSEIALAGFTRQEISQLSEYLARIIDNLAEEPQARMPELKTVA